MRTYGFSTGALGKQDVSHALQLVAGLQTDAVEYSALRIAELKPLVDRLIRSGTGGFKYVAFHAPSQFSAEEEPGAVSLLKALVDKFAVLIVVHPDTIHNFSLWRTLGKKLCIENMDHRKPVGRTATELEHVFAKLPEARLCFDIGHAHEIDRSMSLGFEIVRRYRNRIAHVHASEVSDDCKHRPFSASSRAAFMKIADLIPASAAIILETVVPEDRAGDQLEEARHIFPTQ